MCVTTVVSIYIYIYIYTHTHTHTHIYIYMYIYIYMGHAVAQLVGALRYKLEGRGFDSRWCHWIFS